MTETGGRGHFGTDAGGGRGLVVIVSGQSGSVPRRRARVASRREQALDLAEDLLSDFELNRLPPMQLVLKASRLARFLDDHVASTWLHYEIVGYTSKPNGLDAEAWAATAQSGRRIHGESGERVFTTSVSELQAVVAAKRAQLSAASDAPVSVTSANPHQFVVASGGNTAERNLAAKAMVEAQAVWTA